MPGNYLTTRNAAQLLGISVRTVQLWVDSGKLHGWTTQGGHRRISHQSVLESLALRVKAELDVPSLYELPLLIVEDELALIKLYRAHIRTWPFGVRVTVTPNGYEALVLAGEVKPALMICDLRLPGVNGFQIVRALAEMERFNRMRIVVISGLPDSEIEAHGGLPAGVEVMCKPIDFQKLKALAQTEWDIRVQERAKY